MPDPLQPSPVQQPEALLDYKGIILLDEYTNASEGNTLWRAQEENLADRPHTLLSELAYMRAEQRNHNISPMLVGAGKFDSPHWESFEKMETLRDKYYLKNLRLYQDNPNHENVRNTLLSGMQSVGHIPWQSIVTQYPDGKSRADIPPSWVVDKSSTANNTVNQIPFDMAAFPHPNKDNTGYDYKPLMPHTTSFFKNQAELTKAIAPIYTYAPEAYKNLSIKQLVSANNAALEKGDADPRWFDPEMIPDFEDEPQLILGWLGGDEEEGDDDDTVPSQVIPFGDAAGGGGGGTEDAFKLNVDMEEFFLASEQWDKEEPVEEDPKKKYWEERVGATDWRKRDPLKEYLRNSLVGVLWESSTDEERKAAKQFAGLVGSLTSQLPPDEKGNKYKSNISLDADGSAFLRNNAKGFSSEVFGEIGYFQDMQSHLLVARTPSSWTGRATPRNPDGGFYNKNLNNLSKATFRHMQTMMKDKTEGWPKTPGTGTAVRPEDEEKVTDPALYERTYAAMVGLGMEAADPTEMDKLVGLMSRYLRLRHSAALRGYVSDETWGSRAGATYGGQDGSKPMAYDFERRDGRRDLVAGRTESSSGWFSQLSGIGDPDTTSYMPADPKNSHLNYNNDPVYEMVRTFMQDAEKFVVLAGKDGKEVIPLVEYMGLASFKGNQDDIGTLILPNRVNGLRLLGTDVSQFRNINLDKKIGAFRGTLHHEESSSKRHREGERAAEKEDAFKNARLGGEGLAPRVSHRLGSGKSKDVLKLQKERYTGDTK